ncbi:hypothetical protein [Fimbriiglobus ruber]|uniref:Putative serine proteinase, subtilase family n=1 Tax=Fimbriiglobus ruber TaxID=1908690 RepID=A0A225DQ94_9BACT|nr:hypothetical protein [Fimbriiglobus ruber]OWK43461.1 putative serine proteinase, subtilase family [Fimbriiglobus ruber]
MRRTLSRAAALAALTLGSVALAQQPPVSLPAPRIASAFPAGAQAGTTIEVTVNGTDLDDGPELHFSHPGIKAEVIVPTDPKAADPKAKTEMKGKGGRKKGGPPLAAVKFKVTVPADVPVGQYDVRAINGHGVSNPRAFVVGDRPEVDEQEPNDEAQSPEPTMSLAGGLGAMPNKNVPRAQRIELGTTINGTIATPTDVDYMVFSGKAGQRVLASCLASSIDSRARPLVEIYDPAGKRLGLNRNYHDTDALVDITLPADGDYYVRVSEFAYQQGGPDYFYRLTVGTGPWVDAVFPPVVNPGKPTQVTLYGRNLPGGKPAPGMAVDGRPVETLTVTVTPPADPAARHRMSFHGRVAPPMGLQDGFEYRLVTPNGSSNAVPLFLTDAKIHVEKEAGNDKYETAEEIPVPCEVAGRIDRRYDRDFYSFAAKKGEVYYVELLAERIGSLTDLYLRIRDDKNKELAGDPDDDIESLHPVTFFSRSSDPPVVKFTAPADGKVLILVGSNDANVSYGPRCAYRLRVTPAAPDFRAVVMARSHDQPATVVAQADGEAAYDVFVHRTDGFTGTVVVTAENLPPGVTAAPAFVGSTVKWGTLVLSASAGAKEFTGPITVKCTATIGGKPVVREARPATITWGIPGQQQNIATVTRLDRELIFAVRTERAAFRLTTDLANAKIKTKDKDGKEKEDKVAGEIFLKPGDKLTVPVKIVWQEKEARANPLNISAEATQQNMQNAPVSVNNGQPMPPLAKDKNESPVTIDVKTTAPPGSYAVALRGETQIQVARDPAQKDKKTPANVEAYALPIAITVLPLTLAKVTVTPPANNQLKLGTTAELTVKVDRQFDYAGEFAVTVTLPKEAAGVTVKPATIPAGKDEVKIPIEVAKDAKVGGLSNVIVHAVATVHGKFPITQETKFNLNVAK